MLFPLFPTCLTIKLWMACFDFAHIMGSVISFDIIPHENLIQSICTILSKDKEGLPVIRNVVYDSSMGDCLGIFHSSCPDVVVKLSAAALVNIFLSQCLEPKPGA
ncbi:hypothetical protein Dsin_022107 [Dipteronia sinensis]|uniref:Uncharacterized protein n=1 Tax=Dipteronia sinensis TaxID=43782 RepID=A0AAE0A1S0_9ROSI|nr:hypothetical protein Dsin_022107 [Dipteronia sinensis]